MRWLILSSLFLVLAGGCMRQHAVLTESEQVWVVPAHTTVPVKEDGAMTNTVTDTDLLLVHKGNYQKLQEELDNCVARLSMVREDVLFYKHTVKRFLAVFFVFILLFFLLLFKKKG